MKICSTCKRTYDDDTLVFCLDDGTRLSNADPDPDRTVMLPTGPRPTEPSPAPPQETIPAFGYSYASPRVPEKRRSNLWIVVTVMLVLMLIGLIAVIALFVWRANNTRTPEVVESYPAAAPLATPASSPSAVPAKPSPSVEPKPTATPDLTWLEGVWEGEGFQTDTKTTWAIKLTVRGDAYTVEYPDIPCDGRWDMIDKNSREARFSEVITQGTDRCGNNGGVMVEKVSASEISARFTHAGSRAVIATVMLSKKAQ
jgi:hypothetical protein